MAVMSFNARVLPCWQSFDAAHEGRELYEIESEDEIVGSENIVGTLGLVA